MTKLMDTENDVKKSLDVDSFSDLSNEKIVKFVTSIPNMNRDVAVSIFEQITSNTENFKFITSLLSVMCSNALKANGESQKEAILAYQKILDDLGEVLKKDTITAEERLQLAEKMILVADRISAKDTENKVFIMNTIKVGISGIVIGGLYLLGKKVDFTNFPQIKSK